MRIAAILLVALLAAALAHAQPSGEPPAREPRYKLRGNGLVISPGKESMVLAFNDGVTISGKDFELAAQKVLISIQLTELREFADRLPKGLKDKEPSGDLGDAAREMARELELPEPAFSASALRRVEASGGIVAKAQGSVLHTPKLVSTDGGRSWLAEGRSTLSRKAGGEDYQLSAGALLYDTVKQRAVAHGGVEATVKQKGEPEIKLSADKLEFGLASGELSLSGKLRVAYGDFVVTSGPLSGNVNQQSMSGGKASASGPGGMRASVGQVGLNLKQQRVTASGGVSMTDDKNSLTLNASSVGANLKTQQLEASGGVSLSDKLRGVEVSAGSVSVNLKTSTLIAGGSPTVKFGGSTFSGEKITVSQEKGKTVVEVEGEQHAKIDPGDVEKLSQ